LLLIENSIPHDTSRWNDFMMKRILDMYERIREKAKRLRINLYTQSSLLCVEWEPLDKALLILISIVNIVIIFMLYNDCVPA